MTLRNEKTPQRGLCQVCGGMNLPERGRVGRLHRRSLHEEISSSAGGLDRVAGVRHGVLVARAQKKEKGARKGGAGKRRLGRLRTI